MTLPPGFVAVPLAKGCVCVIPEWVYVAGLKLGKTLRRQAARGRRCLQKHHERRRRDGRSWHACASVQD